MASHASLSVPWSIQFVKPFIQSFTHPSNKDLLPRYVFAKKQPRHHHHHPHTHHKHITIKDKTRFL
jgi:hypothetical protein